MSTNVHNLLIAVVIACLSIAFLTEVESLHFLWDVLAWVLLAGVAYAVSLLVWTNHHESGTGQ